MQKCVYIPNNLNDWIKKNDINLSRLVRNAIENEKRKRMSKGLESKND